MKRVLAMFVATVLTLSLAGNVFATASSPEDNNDENISVDAAITAAEEYMTAWFAEKLSEHYELYNFVFTFSTASCENGEFDSYGYLEVDHHLRYESIDQLPYVKGVMNELSISSMETILDGDYIELESVISASAISDDTEMALTEAQTMFLVAALDEQFSAVQEDMSDFNASYFFHIVAEFDGELLSNIVITLEAEDVGYLSADECLPGTSAELFSDGVAAAENLVAMATAYNEAEVASALESRTYANYDRIAARDYALQYAKNPTQSCKCGTLSYDSTESFPDGVTYSAWNTSEYPYFSLFCHNDCADFVSQAMSEGGLPEGGTWFRTKNVSTQSWGSAWTSVSNMKSYMTANGYWTVDQYSTCNAGNILLTSSGHVTMITLNNTVTHCYTGHTNDRRNVSFTDKSAYAYYAINLD